MMKKNLLFTFLIILTAFSAHATTIYVNENATGNNDGSSWANAYNELYDAVNIATNGDSIWVANGTYRPASATMDAAFELNYSIHIFGSFNGTETSLNQRTMGNQTIVSGDFNNDDPSNFTLSNYSSNRSDNARSVFFINPYNNGAVTLDGLAIMGGYANRPSNQVKGRIGGGVGINNNYDCSVKIVSCHFEQNYTRDGDAGGAAIGIFPGTGQVSDVTIQKTVFTGNVARAAGVIFNYAYKAASTANIVLQDCRFEGNETNREIFYSAKTSWNNTAEAHARLYNCTFIGNNIVNNDPSNCTVINTWQGGSSSPKASLVVRNSIFANNTVPTSWDIRAGSHSAYPNVYPETYLYNNYHESTLKVEGGVITDSLNVIGGWSLDDCSHTINAGSTDPMPGDDLNLIAPITFSQDRNGVSRVKLGKIDLGDTEFGGLAQIIANMNDSLVLGLADAYNCASIQWLDCDNNNQPVPGATSASFGPPSSGRYAAELTYGDGTVVETTICVNYTATSNTQTSISENDIKVFPNPAYDILNIETEEVISRVELFDMTGRRHTADFYNQQLNIQSLPVGMFILKIYTEKGNITKRFLKQ